MCAGHAAWKLSCCALRVRSPAEGRQTRAFWRRAVRFADVSSLVRSAGRVATMASMVREFVNDTLVTLRGMNMRELVQQLVSLGMRTTQLSLTQGAAPWCGLPPHVNGWAPLKCS